MQSDQKVTIGQLRAEQYEHHRIDKYPVMYQPLTSPYTWFKSRFYMEASAILVYFLLKTTIHPNTITLIYGLSGLVGGALIASGYTSLVIAGVVMFLLVGYLTGQMVTWQENR